ncbi:hypothetical protein [Brunnivagina elsteri]|uniref:hypothetical protein n=1 Tax=Brunnivagina elsteri TaxID=1247191 RepID=UPI001178679F|nr:hypothetical protein [Calothrix elsteri]
MTVCEKISGYLVRYAFGIKLCLSHWFNIPDFYVQALNLTTSIVRSRGYGSLRSLDATKNIRLFGAICLWH